MFGSYSVINVIVLLNLLIAMMSNSYAVIEVIKNIQEYIKYQAKNIFLHLQFQF